MAYDDGVEIGIVPDIPELYRISVATGCKGYKVRVGFTRSYGDRSIPLTHEVVVCSLPQVQFNVVDG